MLYRLSLIICLIVVILPRTIEAQSQYPALETLPPCNFNAYTDRDDILLAGIVLNVESGKGCMQNLNSTFPIASVGKIFVLATLYDQINRGLEYPFREIQFTADYLMNGRDDCLNASQVDLYFRLEYLAEVMIWCSDNVATWMLMDHLGWDTVNSYVQSLGIEGIGEVVPYSEVDRTKLSLLDERWQTVPANLASQFYRRQMNEGLVPTYFEDVPFYRQEDLRDANARYMADYRYNTATPRALMEYMLWLRDVIRNSPDSPEGLTARKVFSTMLLTQRQYTTQAYPGNVYVGSKNGFDYGLRAEINFTVDNLLTDRHIPDTFTIVMARVRDITDTSFPYRLRNTPIEQTLWEISPAIRRLIYPDASTEQPTVVRRDNVQMITLSAEGNLRPCWQNYPANYSLSTLESCWQEAPPAIRLPIDQQLGVGVVVRDLATSQAHLTLVYTLPNGFIRSYQLQYLNSSAAAFAWFEDVSIPGIWRLDIYFELAPVFSQNFLIQEAE